MFIPRGRVTLNFCFGIFEYLAFSIGYYWGPYYKCGAPWAKTTSRRYFLVIAPSCGHGSFIKNTSWIKQRRVGGRGCRKGSEKMRQQRKRLFRKRRRAWWTSWFIKPAADPKGAPKPLKCLPQRKKLTRKCKINTIKRLGANLLFDLVQNITCVAQEK